MIGPALLDQAHHRMGFCHPIRQCILRQHHARNDHHAMSILGPHQTPVIDDLQVQRVASLRKKIFARGSHTSATLYSRSKKRTVLGSTPEKAHEVENARKTR